MRIPALLSLVTLAFTACAPAIRANDDIGPRSPCDPGLYWTQYYNNTDHAGTAALARCEYSVGGNFAGSPAAGVNADNFSVDAVGSLNFPVTGDYVFSTMSGDTVARVSLDGEVLLDHPATRNWGTDEVTRQVNAGPHTVRVTYANTNGSAVQEFSVSQSARGPAPTDGSYFATNSFWRQPISPGAPADPQSARWVAALMTHPDIHDIDVNEVIWTTAIYRAARGTPTAPISIRNSGKTVTVPYLPSFRPPQDTDAHLAIIDDATGCEYEFQSFRPESMSAIAQATYHVDTGSGGHVSGPAHSGGELSYLGGLITPEDVRAGVINHALRFAIPVNAPTYVFPGTRSDGQSLGGVPEGIRIQLDPALDLRSFNLSPFQTMVATALQKYGAFDADHADTFAISARSVVDGTVYSTAIQDLPKELIGHLRFLTPAIGSTDIQLDTAQDNGCQQQR